MMKRAGTSIVVLGLVAGACGGSGGGGSGTRATVSNVVGPDGAAATYRMGMLPAPSGSLTVTVPPTGSGINGGSVMITVDAGATAIVKIYIAVEGTDGYWEVGVPSGATLADVLLTIARQLPAATTSFTVVFEVADAAGNVSAPVTSVISVTHVGTGDIQVSVSWDVDNDIDLHVVDPNGFEVYWFDDTSPELGTLDLDSNAACSIDSIRNENIVWPSGKAPPGTYTVRVDNFENCLNAAANYVVTVQKAGAQPQTFTGSFAADDPGDFGQDGAGTTITTFTYP
jgi:hypothetical protein